MDDTTYSGIMLITTTPHPALSEADFNTWYDTVHIPELQTNIKGIEAVERFRTESAGKPLRYLAVYWISRPAEDILADIRQATLSDTTPMLDMVDNPPVIASYDALG